MKEVFDKSGFTVVEFARRINTSRENVYGIFKRKSLDVILLYEIGKVLNYNFFEGFIDTRHSPYQEIEELKEKLEVKDREIEYLRKINELQEKRDMDDDDKDEGNE
ncbi:MAG: hypothetical protein OEX02_10765 [Cyclobacteriaceae bacterium]|nr:hypothetical protein [Cyclobacteriaceae bacterium]